MPNEENEKWADSAIQSLKGCTFDFSVFGMPVGQAVVLEAFRYKDELLGEGVWVEVVTL